MIANLAELPPEAIHQLDMADYLAIQQVLSGFLSHRATSSSSTPSSSSSRSTPTGGAPTSSTSRSTS
ncbi:phage tail assembly protein [Lamprobacter modestohalophilus]|uniref:phage tail assembly protein n=1 Tax=Lamprobacter modestohalophilus TaxID=1064514 RepID=UPI003D189AA5